MIKVTEDIYIDADEFQYILTKKTIRQDNKIKYKVLGYYSTVSGALEGYAKRHFQEHARTSDMTLSEAVTAFKRIEAGTKKLVPM